jgi:predicted nucleic acid-binding protein
MNSVFADTSFFVAFGSEQDRHHEAARKFEENYLGSYVTTDWVLVEYANYYSAKPKRSKMREIIELLRANANFSIVEATRSSFDTGLLLYDERRDKRWSLTDCISFNVMEALNITHALTADHHFEQAGFTVLLK